MIKQEKSIGEIIAEAREKKGLSQRQLAKLAKINNSELSKIEAGIRKDPSPRILRKISSIIDVNYSDLMYSIGLGLEVTPLNYFIKNHYSNLNAEELETAEINVLGSIENSEKLVESCEKQLENQNREWDVKRILTKNNYVIHTDAIKNYILPDNDFYKNKEWLKYAEEADILNVVIFNTTAKKWRELNPELDCSGFIDAAEFASTIDLSLPKPFNLYAFD